METVYSVQPVDWDDWPQGSPVKSYFDKEKAEDHAERLNKAIQKSLDTQGSNRCYLDVSHYVVNSSEVE